MSGWRPSIRDDANQSLTSLDGGPFGLLQNGACQADPGVVQLTGLQTGQQNSHCASTFIGVGVERPVEDRQFCGRLDFEGVVCQVREGVGRTSFQLGGISIDISGVNQQEMGLSCVIQNG